MGEKYNFFQFFHHSCLKQPCVHRPAYYTTAACRRLPEFGDAERGQRPRSRLAYTVNCHAVVLFFMLRTVYHNSGDFSTLFRDYFPQFFKTVSDQLSSGCLAGTVFSNEAEYTVFRHSQIQSVQNRFVTEALLQAGDAQHIHQASSLPSRK